MYSWMRSWFTMENSATYIFNVCLTCQRMWDPDLVDAGKPICILRTWHAERILERYDAGNPVECDLPEWLPIGCGMKLEM